MRLDTHKEPVDRAWACTEKRLIVSDAGEQCVWAHQHMWNNSSIRDSSVGSPWIGSGMKGNPAFIFAREVSVVVDMVIDV